MAVVRISSPWEPGTRFRYEREDKTEAILSNDCFSLQVHLPDEGATEVLAIGSNVPFTVHVSNGTTMCPRPHFACITSHTHGQLAARSIAPIRHSGGAQASLWLVGGRQESQRDTPAMRLTLDTSNPCQVAVVGHHGGGFAVCDPSDVITQATPYWIEGPGASASGAAWELNGDALTWEPRRGRRSLTRLSNLAGALYSLVSGSGAR